MQMQKEKVVFLKDLDNEGEIVAVFPDQIFPDGSIGCYAHIGQHSVCAKEWARDEKRLEAVCCEAYNLYHELTDLIGYNLEIVGKSAIQKVA